MFKKFITEFLSLNANSELQENKDLKNLTTFKIGGKARVFVTINCLADLYLLIQLAKKYNLETFCLGGGSKVLVVDKKINKIIYTLKGKFAMIEKIDNHLVVGAGVGLPALCSYFVANNLAHLEWSMGIPASIGGAIYNNAGCFGHDFGEIIEKVIYTDGRRLYTLEKKYLEFSYRKSFFQNKGLIILFAIIKIEKATHDVKKKTLEYFNLKKSLQPYEYASCGSIFKKGTLPAPLFIEKHRLKGYKAGDAEVSQKHCGFIINKKNAKAKQVLKIIYKIKKTVWQKDAILLDNEVILLGAKENGFFRRLSHPHSL